MRVYNINKAVGLASSGVEYAQVYRRRLFADIPWVDDYYVFTDYIGTNISYFSDRLDFPRPQVLWIYNLVTGRGAAPFALTIEAFVSMISQPHSDPQPRPGHIEVALTDSAVRYRIKTTDDRYVDRVETVVRDQLVRVDHYDASLNNVEYFHDNHLLRRDFYTPGGVIAAQQFYRGDAIARTLITPASPLHETPHRRRGRRSSSFRGDIVLEGRSQFFQFVFAHLFSRPDDLVIVDRALDVIDGIYPVIGEHRLYSVVHAEHFDLKQIDDGVLLWNNHYENVFTRPELVDGLIVSTHRQRERLEHQLAAQGLAGDLSVTCIPVGIAAPVAVESEHDPFAVVTASRLAEEKHIDVLIRAVSAARKRLPELRLDIYGEGDRGRLIAVIDELHAAEYVTLKGHHKLEGVLGAYGLYASASTSEGFGLSLLEALAEGLPIVGFDVDYGNREMVESGVNGCLVPCTLSDRDVDALADAIVHVLDSPSVTEMRRESLRKAEGYTAANVRKLWERLLREGEPC
ncbi:glycosyltransferase [Gryllotalpicola reticulitermitis]|uniref:Glycosyltransferase n=1 Tax=Gryllotalpicola reticulitermitis TaxID=1184153 RepID=A0ABV8Q2M3_9MICO